MALALLGTAVERLALDRPPLAAHRGRRGEEAFGKGQKGSLGDAAQEEPDPVREPVRPRAPAARRTPAPALEDVALWHERDISHSSVERVIGPDATGLADFMVRRAAGLVDGLVVNAERMRENLERTGGLYFSEAVMLALVAQGLARQAAYELVQRSALARASAGEGELPRAARAPTPTSRARLDAAEIDRAFDLEHHLRHAGAIIDRALAEETVMSQADRRSR